MSSLMRPEALIAKYQAASGSESGHTAYMALSTLGDMAALYADRLERGLLERNYSMALEAAHHLTLLSGSLMQQMQAVLGYLPSVKYVAKSHEALNAG